MHTCVHGSIIYNSYEMEATQVSSTDERIKKMSCVSMCVCVCSPGGSEGKESACNTEDPGSIPGSGRSPGEENGYPL